jgi:hypothetical protein
VNALMMALTFALMVVATLLIIRHDRAERDRLNDEAMHRRALRAELNRHG